MPYLLLYDVRLLFTESFYDLTMTVIKTILLVAQFKS